MVMRLLACDRYRYLDGTRKVSFFTGNRLAFLQERGFRQQIFVQNKGGGKSMKEWYQISTEDVMENMQTTSNGLHEEEVKKRREAYGENVLAEGRRKQCCRYFWGSLQTCLS